MMAEEFFMRRCLELAANGKGMVEPNPMVGCVIVHSGKIIGEGWHQKFGENHAEVNAINSVKDKSLIAGSKAYVSLEPCAHFGKTPPCSNLLIEHQIAEVFIGCVDTFSKVSGKGIEKLKAAGIKVSTGILENEARELNKRFFTFHEKQRPYIILKYAQTADGFIDKLRAEGAPKGLQNKISGDLSRMLSHKWRSEEASILVGTNTALNDNPKLNVRDWHGKQPVRLVIDKKLRLPGTLHLFDKSIPTIVFTTIAKESQPNLEFKSVDFNALPESICKELFKQNIQSVIIEGGKKLLDSFIDANLWDEARVFVSPVFWQQGLKAPEIKAFRLIASDKIGADNLFFFQNDSL
ncbi:MAG: bifunctional diaminohydroxyphosphoribosylaminopyrimidine deaminase/5-amino-6-(5-phosphoribosylamino)uracil reductase RibD [Bacteroidetes bacterium]|nr:bifunctional diaminohydroxyphosphoribosylaminopyrimidine deaminase/5-amino-6-(5-phosphoribosylamino)uracil reductase RibD [Bacteroidota bacterium]